MKEYINKIINESSLVGLKKIPDKVIDCCVTSPPYWKLRDYGHPDQIGQEPTFQEYINNLLSVFNEIKRILKDTGTCFVNLGDNYGSGSSIGNPNSLIRNNKSLIKRKPTEGYHKCLLMIPERFSIHMIEKGWILRNQIIWHKPNQMPQSATDRFTVDFEKIFFFTKSTEYYFEQQLDPYTKPLDRWGGDNLEANGNSTWDKGTGQASYRNRNMRPNPEGKNMRTVWSINTVAFPDAHFATFPEKLAERMILAGCPENGIVLDPFSGAGTVPLVSKKLNRNFCAFEINPKYITMSNNRIYNKLGMFL